MAPCQPQKDSALNTEIESLKVNTNALILTLKLSWIFLDLKRRGHGQGKMLMKDFLFGLKMRVKILPLQVDDLDVEDSAPCRLFSIRGASGITEQPIR